MDFCVPILCEGGGARRLLEGAATGAGEGGGGEPAYEELRYDELYHGSAIGDAPPRAAAAFEQRLSRRLESRDRRIALQATRTPS